MTTEPLEMPRIERESAVVPIPIILDDEGRTPDFEDITSCPVLIPIVDDDPTTERAVSWSEPNSIIPVKLVTKVSPISSVTGSS